LGSCTPFLASSHPSLYPLTYPELYSALCLLPGLLSKSIESVIELYEAGCADYIFNFVIDSNKSEEKLVTPVLMYLVDKKIKEQQEVVGSTYTVMRK
jgi:hypothetical protein